MPAQAQQLQAKAPTEIPATFPFKKYDMWSLDMDQRLVDYNARHAWMDVGMFAFVCWEWVKPLVEWLGNRRVLEVMAGAGWLAKALREKGIDVIATDNGSWPKERGWTPQSEVEELDALLAIEKYADQTDILVMSWPYMDDRAFEVIKLWDKLKPGAMVIYIGESDGGCTADEQFFRHFEDVEDPTFEQVSGRYIAWWGIHDRVCLGRYQHATNTES
jgi:hypothetical protein